MLTSNNHPVAFSDWNTLKCSHTESFMNEQEEAKPAPDQEIVLARKSTQPEYTVGSVVVLGVHIPYPTR